MIQKRSYNLSTKTNRHFYDTVKIRVKIIQNVKIFTIYEVIFENVSFNNFTENLNAY